jgi:hypothetical protein
LVFFLKLFDPTTIPTLKEENRKENEKYDEIIREHRLFTLGKKILQKWREVKEDEIKEREREKFKNRMWSKVNTWLDEIDKKHLDKP